MWALLAKTGGLILGTLGIDYAVDAYKENQAAQAQAEQNQKIGKVIIGASAIYLAYLLLKKVK